MKLLMLTLEAPKATQFIEDFEQAYQLVPEYLPASHYEPVASESRDSFARRRRDTIQNFIRSNAETIKDDPRAYMAEWATYISLSVPLERAGYQIDLAPENLETGYPGRRGIDLVISDTNDDLAVPLLGVNIKLQRLPPEQRSDSHRFDPMICAPSINLSLGNWEILTREQEPKRIRAWIDELALPRILNTGKIPYIRSLRAFVITDIKRTLDVYAWKIQELREQRYELNEHQSYLLPTSPLDMAVLEDKLVRARQLFAELNEDFGV